MNTPVMAFFSLVKLLVKPGKDLKNGTIAGASCDFYNFTSFLSISGGLEVNTAWKVSKYGVFSASYFPVFGLSMERYGFSPYSVRIWENMDQNNSKYGPE